MRGVDGAALPNPRAPAAKGKPLPPTHPTHPAHPPTHLPTQVSSHYSLFMRGTEDIQHVEADIAKLRRLVGRMQESLKALDAASSTILLGQEGGGGGGGGGVVFAAGGGGGSRVSVVRGGGGGGGGRNSSPRRARLSMQGLAAGVAASNK